MTLNHRMRNGQRVAFDIPVTVQGRECTISGGWRDGRLEITHLGQCRVLTCEELIVLDGRLLGVLSTLLRALSAESIAGARIRALCKLAVKTHPLVPVIATVGTLKLSAVSPDGQTWRVDGQPLSFDQLAMRWPEQLGDLLHAGKAALRNPGAFCSAAAERYPQLLTPPLPLPPQGSTGIRKKKKKTPRVSPPEVPTTPPDSWVDDALETGQFSTGASRAAGERAACRPMNNRARFVR